MRNIAKYVGIKYADKGSSFDGCDCYGLVRLIYKEELGIELPDYFYLNSNHADSVNGAIESGIKQNIWKPVEKPGFGDLLFFRIKGKIVHVGLRIDAENFIHCLGGRNASVEKLTSLIWERSLAYSRAHFSPS